MRATTPARAATFARGGAGLQLERGAPAKAQIVEVQTNPSTVAAVPMLARLVATDGAEALTPDEAERELWALFADVPVSLSDELCRERREEARREAMRNGAVISPVNMAGGCAKPLTTTRTGERWPDCSARAG